MLGNRPWRNEVSIATKISANHKPSPPIKTIKEYYQKDLILCQIEDSLRRLKKDQIDLLQLHKWYNEWLPEADYVFDVLQRLKLEGKVKALGVSLPNWLNQDINALLLKQVVDVIQVPFNLFQQWSFEQVIKPAHEDGVGILVRSPLDSGSLATLADRIDQLPEIDFRKNMFSQKRLRQLRIRIENVNSMVGLTKDMLPYYAIAFCHQQLGVSSVITGMRTLDHVKDNTDVQNYKFTSEQLAKGINFRWDRGW